MEENLSASELAARDEWRTAILATDWVRAAIAQAIAEDRQKRQDND
jgi:hypothetical protein